MSFSHFPHHRSRAPLSATMGYDGSESQPGGAIFDVAVVGLGMMGSAACKYLSAAPEAGRVLGIGAEEPPDWLAHEGPFSSHYDGGRLTRIVDKDPVWSLLAARSIASYGVIEAASVARFHHAVGSLRVTPFRGQPGDSMDAAYEQAVANGADVEIVAGSDALARSFPYMRFQDGDSAIMERGGAGYVNPRALVAAQKLIASKQGATLVGAVARSVRRGEGGLYDIETERRGQYRCRAVLVAADAWTNHLLLGPQLDLRPQAVSVLLAEVGEDEVRRLQGMPSLIYRLAGHPFLHSIYSCPPAPYPDGKYYIKIGGTVWEPIFRRTPGELVSWFHGSGREEECEHLKGVLSQLLPGLKVEAYVTKPCIVSYTSHNYPYIDKIADGSQEDSKLFVLAGGCGAAAKSSDAIGRIAADVVLGRGGDSELVEKFRAVYMTDKVLVH